ncbi:unnamed protein product, partial [Polarella glacialis]
MDAGGTDGTFVSPVPVPDASAPPVLVVVAVAKWRRRKHRRQPGILSWPKDAKELGEKRDLLVHQLSQAQNCTLAFVVRRPLTFTLAAQLVIGPLCIAVCFLTAIDPDTQGMMHRNSEASLLGAAYRDAWLDSAEAPRQSQRAASGELVDDLPIEELYGPFSSVSGNASQPANASGGRRLGTSNDSHWVHFPLQLLYSHDGLLGRGHLLTELSLFAIRQFEENLRQGLMWRQLCAEGGADSSNSTLGSNCNPGESLVSFVWPEGLRYLIRTIGGSSLPLTGRGSQRLPVEWALATFGSGSAEGGESLDRLRRFLPEDFVLPEGEEAKALSLRQRYSTAEAAMQAFRGFLLDELRPALRAEVRRSDLPNFAAEGASKKLFLAGQGLSVYALSAELAKLEAFLLLGEEFGLSAGVGAPLLLLALVAQSSRGWRSAFVLSIFGLFLLFESVLLGFGITWLIVGRNPSAVNSFALFLLPWLCADVLLVELSAGWDCSISALSPVASQSPEVAADK